MTLWYLSWFPLWLGPFLCFHAVFLRQSSYFFSLTWTLVGHFSALLLLFSVLRCCLQVGLQLELSWPGKSRHCAPAPGGALPSTRCVTALPTACAREWLTLLRHAPQLWLVVLIQEWWIPANQIRATGWSHRQLTCIWFYRQIIIIILATIPQK